MRANQNECSPSRMASANVDWGRQLIGTDDEGKLIARKLHQQSHYIAIFANILTSVRRVASERNTKEQRCLCFRSKSSRTSRRSTAAHKINVSTEMVLCDGRSLEEAAGEAE